LRDSIFFLRGLGGGGRGAVIEATAGRARARFEEWAQYEEDWQFGYMLEQAFVIETLDAFTKKFGKLATTAGVPQIVEPSIPANGYPKHWVVLELTGLTLPESLTSLRVLADPQLWRTSPGLRAASCCQGFVVAQKERVDIETRVFEFAPCS